MHEHHDMVWKELSCRDEGIGRPTRDRDTITACCGHYCTIWTHLHGVDTIAFCLISGNVDICDGLLEPHCRIHSCRYALLAPTGTLKILYILHRCVCSNALPCSLIHGPGTGYHMGTRYIPESPGTRSSVPQQSPRYRIRRHTTIDTWHGFLHTIMPHTRTMHHIATTQWNGPHHNDRHTQLTTTNHITPTHLERGPPHKLIPGPHVQMGAALPPDKHHRDHRDYRDHAGP